MGTKQLILAINISDDVDIHIENRLIASIRKGSYVELVKTAEIEQQLENNTFLAAVARGAV